jgi:hypothetical protein
MALFDRETDPAKERDGVPIVFADYDYVRLTLARTTNNERLKLEVERITREFRGRVGAAVEAERERAWLLAVCRICIGKWETLLSTMRPVPTDVTPDADGYAPGIDMRGKLIPYTPERAVEVFETRGLEDFREAVLHQSRQGINFRLQNLETDTGN